MKEIYDGFIIRRLEAIKNSENYEQNESLEMAYLALWSVSEHTVKAIARVSRNQKLKEQLEQWLCYLSSGGNQPDAIKNFTQEVKSIPQVSEIEKFLSCSLPALTKLFQTKKKGVSGKYRDKRNNIAHIAESFSDKTLFYDDYKPTALAAIDELKLKLEVMLEKSDAT